MLSHRRINTAWDLIFNHNFIVQRITHTVQTLELKAGVVFGHFHNGGDGVGIVGSKLWVNAVTVAKHFLSTGLIRHVGRRLTAEYRKVTETFKLTQFDFGIPVSAFYQ